jgi:transketolase
MNLVKAKVPTRRAFGEELLEQARRNPDFVVFEADIGYSTYSYLFGDEFPERYFNVGIAELGMFAQAAGVAASGRTVFCGSYGVFITMRALEAIRSFICYPNLNVKMISSHGGVTPAIDGVTHQATEDIAIMTTLPNMTVLVPSDSRAAAAAVGLSLETPGPVFTRLMRDPLYELYGPDDSFSVGGSKVVRAGGDVTIVSYGDILFQALLAADRLAAEGISAEVLDLYSLKPYDAHTVLESTSKTGALVVAENHQARNGIGYELASLLISRDRSVPFAGLGFQDTFAESGAYDLILEKYGLSAAHITRAAREVVSRKK